MAFRRFINRHLRLEKFVNKRMVNKKFGKSVAAVISGLLANLVAYYKLDETSSNTTPAIDSIGTNPLGCNGAVTTTAGEINTARSSTGVSNSGYLSCNSVPTFQPGSNPFFVTFWAKCGALSQTTFPALIGKFNDTSNLREWAVIQDGSSGKIGLYVSTDGTLQTIALGPVFPDTTNFHFIAAGWDGTNIMISMDGGAFTTTPFAGPVFSGSAIFTVFYRAGTGSVKTFNGALDEIAFWNGRCLTITDVAALYNGGAGLPLSSFT